MRDRRTHWAPLDADNISAAPTRRTVLKAGIAAIALGGAGLGVGAAIAQAQDATPGVAATDCILTSELTEGPFYLDEALIRHDITEGKRGVPLQLRITVVEPTTCAPLQNAAVDIWHCDALGYYSGASANNPGPDADSTLVAEAAQQTFLRGVQLTDANGVAEFVTIYPGWYFNRTVHIHLKVHVGGTADDDTYEGGHVAHTGQLFFDDAITDQVFEVAPYANRPDARTRNEEDGILGNHDDEPGFFVGLTPLVENSVADGYFGTITIGVDPEATPTTERSGGGQGRPPAGSEGSESRLSAPYASTPLAATD